VPCGIDKDVSVDGILGFRTVLMTDYGLYFFSGETGILLEILLANKRRNPYASFPVFDSVIWEKVHFQENVHTDLRAGVATKHRAILYDGCSGSFSGGSDCRTDTGQAASHYYNFIFSNSHGAKKNLGETGILLEILLANKRRNPYASFPVFDSVAHTPRRTAHGS